MCRVYGSGDAAYIRYCYRTGRAGLHVSALSPRGSSGCVLFGSQPRRSNAAGDRWSDKLCIVCGGAREASQDDREVDTCKRCEREGKA